MLYRTLGRTGVQVSSLVLGAMNFGALGQTTQDEATAMSAVAPLVGTTPPHGQAVRDRIGRRKFGVEYRSGGLRNV